MTHNKFQMKKNQQQANLLTQTKWNTGRQDLTEGGLLAGKERYLGAEEEVEAERKIGTGKGIGRGVEVGAEELSTRLGGQEAIQAIGNWFPEKLTHQKIIQIK